jgi:bifunctional DNA-binding transcriptional regulator/antitoxin component of YhaV-PrlF toxin-antitoxin module
MNAHITMDEVGRLVLPKNIREAIGVFGRMVVSIEVVDKAAMITVPAPAVSPVARKRGRLVHTGPLPQTWDSGQAVLAIRQRRIPR